MNWFTVGVIITAAVGFLPRRAQIWIAAATGLVVVTVGLWHLQPVTRLQRSPHASASNFAKHAAELGEQDRIKKMVDDSIKRGEQWGKEPPGPGSTLAISEIKMTETPDPNAQKSLALQIGIEKHPNSAVDANKVRILVDFYDTVGDKDVELTDADVNYEWLTPTRDWTDSRPELLRVTYVRPKGKSASAKAESGERKYLGYRIRVYYGDELQGFQADPTRLLQLFPPSESLVGARLKSSNSSRHDTDRSPKAGAANFANYAMKLREQEIREVPPLSEPTALHAAPAVQRYPWKTNIVTTVFWIGEKQVHESVWDKEWEKDYGGIDNPDPSARRNYIPVAFIPRQNPFYCALPYNDVTHGQFKPEAPLVIPWFKQAYTGPGQSVCWHRWVAIRKGNRTCYAEWEDCGPFRTDHFQYVFGNERPKPNASHGAGLSVSPAVRDYLGLAPTDVTDWQFVEVRDVPPGPWRSYGENNHFVIARRQMEENSRQNNETPKN